MSRTSALEQSVEPRPLNDASAEAGRAHLKVVEVSGRPTRGMSLSLPGEVAYATLLPRVWHPDPLPRKSIPRHSPKLPRPSRTCSGSRGTRSWHPNVVVSQWDLCLEMSLSLAGEVAYATLPPLVTGFHDRPAGRCIVSERIGGTVQRTVGPAE